MIRKLCFTVALLLSSLSLAACTANAEETDTSAESELRVSCMALPSCDEGDTAVESARDCLQDDARCYSRSMCGHTIWCTGSADESASTGATCLAIPTCDDGDEQVGSRSECRRGARCYSRRMCGRTIWCSDR